MDSFNLDDYETVADRIKRFYTDHDDGRITSKLVTDTDVKVVMKAYLYVGETLVSTGYAEEVRGKGMVNITSAMENCETSAVGRALANFNYAGDKRASREEMEKVNRYQQQAEQDKMKTSPVALAGFMSTLKDKGIDNKEDAVKLLAIIDKDWNKLNTSGIARMQKQLDGLMPDTIETLMSGETYEA